MGPAETTGGEAITSRRLQLVVFSGDEIRTMDLPSTGALAIGRGETSAIQIDDPSVSRNHAILHVGPTLAIEDLGSSNGTLVRDRASGGAAAETLNVRQLVKRRAALAVGDTMLFGTASVVVRHAPATLVPDLTTPGDGVVVRDPAMRALYAQAARAAPTPINVLLLGETGVGKEILARAIHARSPRANGPFLGINCAGFTESLLDSELFGHEKGAFTGANQARAGLFEAAAGGTVFLDEVGELSPATQAKLLRVIEDRVVIRVGSTRPRSIDVRFLAATNRDIEAESRTGRFRPDLYFRLNGISFVIPPLRARREEIDDLIRVLLAAACRLVERTEIPNVSSAALDLLHDYPWPGNVRELRNAMERAAVLCPGETILPEHLPPAVWGSRQPAPPHPNGTSVLPATPVPVSDGAVSLPDEIKALERARIVSTLEQCGGNQSTAARLLGVSRHTLISRIIALGLRRPRKRALR
jgi:DNA-binding NtrC family response regulator